MKVPCFTKGVLPSARVFWAAVGTAGAPGERQDSVFYLFVPRGNQLHLGMYLVYLGGAREELCAVSL